MSVVFKKMFFACVVAVMVLTTGAWQNSQDVLAASPRQSAPEAPLFSSLTWAELGSVGRSITTSVRGDAITLSGKGYAAAERFQGGVSQDVADYYSNAQLAASGWTSYDAYDTAEGVHKVFYHEAGYYFAVDFLTCADDSSSTCVTVWVSEKTAPSTAAQFTGFTPDPLATTFKKTSPSSGTINLDPKNLTLTWGTYSPTPDKYSYCVKIGSACDDNDPNWTGTYLSTSIKLTNLEYDKIYYWQVKAITCATCIPKKFVYADDAKWWTFTTKPQSAAGVVILGNVGTPSATLTYVVSGTTKTVSSDGSGGYSITVPSGWTGTITPSKVGYYFTPINASFSNLTAAQTIQNFTATPTGSGTPEISGNAGVAGAILSYSDGGQAKTAIADSTGAYKFTVSANWTGTVTPSQGSYYFTPAYKSYTNVTAHQTGQNYTVSIFYDVPSTHWAFNYIERLYAAGITGGCGTNPLIYCPDGTVTRAEMSVFLLRGIHGSAYVPPAVGSSTGFNDVPASHWAAAWIKQFATEGITGGCGTNLYCPEGKASNAEMAVFLLRSKHGSAYTPPAVGSSTGFSDVPTSYWAAAWIKQLAAEGISTGCGNGKFCPDDAVTRASMAVLMVKTFSLPKQ